MTIERDQILSEFIDSWNAGRRPDIDEHLARVPEEDREGLLEDIVSFLGWAATPEYDEATLLQIRAEPALAAALEGSRAGGGFWPALLPRWRRRASLSIAELASALVRTLGLRREGEEKTRVYLERVEAGELEPSGFSSRLLDGLAEVLKVPRERLESAGAVWQLAVPPAPSAARFRGSEEAAEAVREDLELMADGLARRSGRDFDEVDELFRGGR